jgi:hypothetical protein
LLDIKYMILFIIYLLYNKLYNLKYYLLNPRENADMSNEKGCLASPEAYGF